MLDPIELLTGLMQHDSPSGAEAEAVDYLVAQMKAAGFKANIDAAGNAVGRLGDGPGQVMLLGHIDTVPGEVPLRQAGDLLYGRGTVDAKGPLAAFVAAVAQGPLPGLRLTVIGAVGEEADSPGATYVRDHYPRPDYLIIGEPSRWDRVTLGYKGSAWFELAVERPMAHTASGEASACELAVRSWQRLHAWSQEHNVGQERVFDQLTPTLRAMRSESDGLVERAWLQIGFRLPEKLAPEDLRTAVVEHAGADVRITTQPGAVPAYRATKNTPLVRAALAAIRTEGGAPGFVVKTGTSDMNVVAPVWGCPTIAYGPGDSSLDHTPDEHISLGEYRRSIAVLRRILERLAEQRNQFCSDANGHAF